MHAIPEEAGGLGDAPENAEVCHVWREHVLYDTFPLPLKGK